MAYAPKRMLERAKHIEGIAAKWKGNPVYADTLNMEAAALRIAASQPDREAVAWRIKPSDTLFLVGETITDEPAVAEKWRKAGCEVEALSLLSVQVDGKQKETAGGEA